MNFRDLIQRMSDIDEGVQRDADQVRGKDKAKSTGKSGRHPFQDKLVGESEDEDLDENDYNFLGDELDEDLVSGIKHEMNDYMKSRKEIDAQGPKKFSKRSEKSISAPKPKKIHSKDDPLFDEEIKEGDYDSATRPIFDIGDVIAMKDMIIYYVDNQDADIDRAIVKALVLKGAQKGFPDYRPSAGSVTKMKKVFAKHTELTRK